MHNVNLQIEGLVCVAHRVRHGQPHPPFADFAAEYDAVWVLGKALGQKLLTRPEGRPGTLRH